MYVYIYIYIHICLYMYICISHSTYCTEGVGDLIPHEDKWWVCPSGFSAILCHCFPNMFRLHQSFSSAETISLGHLKLGLARSSQLELTSLTLEVTRKMGKTWGKVWKNCEHQGK